MSILTPSNFKIRLKSLFRRIIIFPGNHKNIFNDARVPWSEYRYYDPKTVGLDFDGMISDIKVMSTCSLFLSAGDITLLPQ